jgi:hypothetical protein
MALTKEEAIFDEGPNGKPNGILEPNEKQKMDQFAQYLNVDELTKTNNPKSGTSSSTTKTKLTTNTARALMQLAAENAGYAGKFSTADIAQFIKEFDAEQNRQIEKVITNTIDMYGSIRGIAGNAVQAVRALELTSLDFDEVDEN